MKICPLEAELFHADRSYTSSIAWSHAGTQISISLDERSLNFSRRKETWNLFLIYIAHTQNRKKLKKWAEIMRWCGALKFVFSRHNTAPNNYLVYSFWKKKLIEK
jgi:hypothetical protein